MKVLENGSNYTVVEEDGVVTLLSYESEILKYDRDSREFTFVGSDWDRSQTTGKHIGKFLDILGITFLPTKKDRQKYFEEKGLI